MWLLFTILHMFSMAAVNYFDEFLTHSTSTSSTASLHEKIGGVLLMSALLCPIALSFLAILAPTLSLTSYGLLLSILSGFTLICVWAIYFYLFQTFSAHQVVPLFGLSSVWLLGLEIISGAAISFIALGGIVILVLGAYLLDNGSLTWKIPSKLLFYMGFNSLLWATTVFLVRQASLTNPSAAIYFWQTLTIFTLGLILFLAIKPYRHGFINRLKQERMAFIGPSILAKGTAQFSFYFGVLATATAPLAVYFTALSGLQSVFLLLLLMIFPLNQRNKTNKAQWFGIILIALGIALLEIGK